MTYLQIFKGLQRAGIDYLVVGELAVNLHGIPRMTYNIDLIISLEKGNVLRTVGLLQRWGYRPMASVDPADMARPSMRKRWKEEKNMKALCFCHDQSGMREIDLIFEAIRPFSALKRRAARISVDGMRVPVVSLDDLILMKEQTGQKQDRDDIELLRALRARKAAKK
jgi:hypothetical protein